MWPSSSTANSNNSNKRVFLCSPSKSTSSSSTCNSSSPSIIIPRKSMEEVWKDINLSSLHQNQITNTKSSILVFQDFLATQTVPNHKLPETKNCVHESSPATVLSLNSGPDFGYLESSDILISPPLADTTKGSSFFTPFDDSSAFPCFPQKRSRENVTDNEEKNHGDRKHKRMMKNRESAARSRARKQAYTNELELEVAHLMEENARLKKEQEKLLLAAVPSELPKQQTLTRTLTAPF